MRITKAEVLHADGGWETWSFLKLSTDEGLIGWAEFKEAAMGAPALADVVLRRAAQVIGLDPRQAGRIDAMLYASTLTAAGGIGARAGATIVNACLDLKAKALGVPVADLFGGAIRDRLPLYWSHCGPYRARFPELFEQVIGVPAVRGLDDIRRLGAEAVQRGYKALKTYPLLFGPNGVRAYQPGFFPGPDHPSLHMEDATLAGIVEQVAAFREGAGPDMGLMLDCNFNFKPEGLRRLIRAIEPCRLAWIEIDMFQPAELARLRAASATPIASLETIYGRRAIRAYLEARAVDVAIIDVAWNSMIEAHAMATLADAYDVNVAGHSFASPFQVLMGAQFAAALPNLRILEYDADQVPWMAELFTNAPVIENGELLLPKGPGWGSDVVEEAVRAHPPRRMN